MGRRCGIRPARRPSGARGEPGAHRVRNLGPGVRLPRALRTLAHEAVVTEDRPHPYRPGEPTAPGHARSSSPAVPLACHSQRSRPVLGGQPRTTRKRPQPTPLTTMAGRECPRTGFGSKGPLHQTPLPSAARWHGDGLLCQRPDQQAAPAGASGVLRPAARRARRRRLDPRAPARPGTPG
jgi:hypothetical protein